MPQCKIVKKAVPVVGQYQLYRCHHWQGFWLGIWQESGRKTHQDKCPYRQELSFGRWNQFIDGQGHSSCLKMKLRSTLSNKMRKIKPTKETRDRIQMGETNQTWWPDLVNNPTMFEAIQDMALLFAYLES